ncbi:DNA adenine methylase [Calothrix sp. NIES-4101]|nr:DNA adenine methylase [Calothrix sp. NIES-4101]
MLTQLSKKTLPRPFLKWAGGKNKLIPTYKSYFPRYHNYYEPFLGGGAVFFHLKPASALLTDINTELIATYNCVRDRLSELIDLLKEHQYQHSLNSRDYYYKIRNNPGVSNVEIAARLIYLNRTCFNGLYRVNSKGQFNVPLGKYTDPKICQVEVLYAASNALQNAQIKQADFTEVLEHAHNSDDFVFFDPPYHPISSTSYFTAYSKNPFNEEDQIRLRDACLELIHRGVKVMICNSDCDFILRLYTSEKFKIYKVKASRNINSNINNRGTIDELLITSCD